ncbi:MAG: branched-chain amino acid ABC transporter permease [Candidatus Rokubacteria bacterium]|nr:branched-chain amino acid ABC transporter permease [Candidatus Rokubacteria bacterium]
MKGGGEKRVPRWVWSAVLPAAVLAVLPQFLGVYPVFVLSLAGVHIVAALGVNLAMGYAGLVSLGHAGFAAIGAYTVALFMLRLGVSYWPALVVGGLGAAGVGFLLAIPSLRLNPLYLAMVTFGFGQVVMLIAQNWVDLTHGPNGLSVPQPLLGSLPLFPEDFYYVTALAVLVMVGLTRNLVDSRLGRAWVALRESEVAAQAMGVPLSRAKILAFTISAFYGGISGGLYAGLSQFVNPDAFVFPISILYVTICLLGGFGTLWGPAVGGLILTVLLEFVRGFAEWREFLFGALLLGLLIFMPKGVIGLLRRGGPGEGRFVWRRRTAPENLRRAFAKGTEEVSRWTRS